MKRIWIFESYKFMYCKYIEWNQVVHWKQKSRFWISGVIYVRESVCFQTPVLFLFAKRETDAGPKLQDQKKMYNSNI